MSPVVLPGFLTSFIAWHPWVLMIFGCFTGWWPQKLGAILLPHGLMGHLKDPCSNLLYEFKMYI